MGNNSIQWEVSAEPKNWFSTYIHLKTSWIGTNLSLCIWQRLCGWFEASGWYIVTLCPMFPDTVVSDFILMNYKANPSILKVDRRYRISRKWGYSFHGMARQISRPKSYTARLGHSTEDNWNSLSHSQNHPRFKNSVAGGMRLYCHREVSYVARFLVWIHVVTAV